MSSSWGAVVGILTAKPRYAGPRVLHICHDGQVAKRLKVAARIQREIRTYAWEFDDGDADDADIQYFEEFTLTQVHLSVMFCLPDLGTLELLKGSTSPCRWADLLWSADALLLSCKSSSHQSRNVPSSSDHLSHPVLQRDMDPEPNHVASTRSPRSGSGEADDASHGNNKCIITQLPGADMRRIWPFPSELGEYFDFRDKLLEENREFLDRHLRSQLLRVHRERSTADARRLNLIPLCSTLRDYWAKAYFGLKWYGVEDVSSTTAATVLLEFHWLPGSILPAIENHLACPEDKDRTRRRVRLNDMDALAGSIWDTLRSPCVRDVRDCHGQRLESGRLVEMSIPAEDVDDLKVLVDAQWLLVRVAALSGTAEHVDCFRDELPPKPPFILPPLPDLPVRT